MFDDTNPDGSVVGEIKFVFLIDEHGRWFTKLEPLVKSGVVRDIYKMAMVVAVLGDTCKRKLDAIDRMIMNNKEISLYNEIRKAEAANKPPGLADIDRYQTKLPFKELKG